MMNPFQSQLIHNSFTFCSCLSFPVQVNYKTLLSLGSSRCCHSFRNKVRCSDRAYYYDIEYGHQPLKIYANYHINNVTNFFDHILVERKITVINDGARHPGTIKGEAQMKYTIHVP